MRLSRLSGLLTGLLLAGPSAAAPEDPPAYQAVFETAFKPGFSVSTPSGLEGDGNGLHQVNFRIVDIGQLIIKSGRICAADPFVSLGKVKPFTQEVPRGEFPVRLAVGDHPAGPVKDSRVAFARLDFSSRPVIRWRMAVIEGQDVSTLKPGEIFGYGVDAGTGSFYDPSADAAVGALYARNPDVWMDWQKAGEENGPRLVGPYSFVLMLPMGDVNVAMFHSGWGDGVYASWFGFDADGNVAALLTDFQTIDWPKSKW